MIWCHALYLVKTGCNDSLVSCCLDLLWKISWSCLKTQLHSSIIAFQRVMFASVWTSDSWNESPIHRIRITNFLSFQQCSKCAMSACAWPIPYTIIIPINTNYYTRVTSLQRYLRPRPWCIDRAIAQNSERTIRVAIYEVATTEKASFDLSWSSCETGRNRIEIFHD